MCQFREIFVWDERREKESWALADRRRIEGFVRSFVRLIFVLDPVVFSLAFAEHQQQQQQQQQQDGSGVGVA
jgi:hypothetical protein